MGRPNEIQDELLQHLVPCPIPFLDAGMNRGIASLPDPPPGRLPSTPSFSPHLAHVFPHGRPSTVQRVRTTSGLVLCEDEIRFLQRIGRHCVSRCEVEADVTTRERSIPLSSRFRYMRDLTSSHRYRMSLIGETLVV